eukprot:g16776.t1
MGMARHRRTRLFESIRSNRKKIGRAMDRLRDAMGLFSSAAKLKLKLAEINQNPFRQGLLDSTTAADGSGGSSDISEDMSWGFDQTFFGEEGAGGGDDDPDDYDDI